MPWKKKQSGDSDTVIEGVEAAAPQSNTRRVKVSKIKVTKNEFRKLDESAVEKLAGSLREVGLMHPPTVYITKKKGLAPERFHLVAGQHRLAAAKQLGWKFIDVAVVKKVDKINRMQQITENLHRADLSKPEEGREILEWLKLRFANGGRVAHSNNKGISEAAKHFNKSRRTIGRLIMAGAISPKAAMLLKDAGLDNNGQVLEQVVHKK